MGAAPLSFSESGSDVLIHSEQIVWIVFALDLYEPIIVLTVVRLDPAGIILVHEVDVSSRLRVRR